MSTLQNTHGEVLFYLDTVLHRRALEVAAQLNVPLHGLNLTQTMNSNPVSEVGDYRGSNFDGLIAIDGVMTSCDFSTSTLVRADLSNSDLRRCIAVGSDFTGATLADSILRSAILSRSKFVDSNLRNVDFRSANLTDADFTGADMRGFKFDSKTIVKGIKLSRANLTGESWETYLSDRVPELLTSGGRSLKEISRAWECHEWTRCPIAMAFNIHDPSDAPRRLRKRVNEFVQLYDLGLIPKPTCT